MTTFFIGSGLAGVAGVALTLIGSTSPTIGQSYLIDAFLVVVIGGLGRLSGAGGRGLRARHSELVHRVPTTASIAKVIVFVLIVIFLQVRPQGCSSPRQGAWYDRAQSLPGVGGIRRRRGRPLRSRTGHAVGLPAQSPGQVPVLRDSRGRHRISLGPWRNAHPRTGCCSSASAPTSWPMHLKIADAELRGDSVPDFMQIAGIRELPSYWTPFADPFTTIAAILLVPAFVAFLLGLGVSSAGSRARTSQSCRRRSRRRSRSCSSASSRSVDPTASIGSARSSASICPIRRTSGCCSSSQPPYCCSSSPRPGS